MGSSLRRIGRTGARRRHGGNRSRASRRCAWSIPCTGCREDQEPGWRDYAARFAAVNAHWDPAQNTYVRPDGTFSPPEPEPVTYPRVWRAHLPVGQVEVTLQRRDAKSVDISMQSKGA